MLFKTVYGPELSGVVGFLHDHGPKSREVLYKSFIPIVEEKQGSSNNLDDALSFLITSRMIEKDAGGLFNAAESGDFLAPLLRNLRSIQLARIETGDPMDQWFLGLLDDLFIRPNRNYLSSVHQTSNQISNQVTFSEERINAWKRVLEFLGLGQRVGAGYRCFYEERIWQAVLGEWYQDESPLQLFLEEHLDNYLPWQDAKGGINRMIWGCLTDLETQGLIKFSRHQDLPYRSYGTEDLFNWISWGEGISR